MSPILNWLTDRSRYKLGTARCGAARYLGYHFGPTGYGITRKAESVPLIAGISVHDGVEQFATILLEHDTLTDEATTRRIVSSVQAKYLAKVEERGYRGVLGGPHTEETIKEQCSLISGLLWSVRLKFLPWLHANFRVRLVEKERPHILTCTCGAGPMDFPQHVARGCEGIVLQLRNDLLAERRTGGGTLAYFEVKTTGWDSDTWSEQWETDPQLSLGTLDIPEQYQREVTELYIVGLRKGARRRDRYDPDGRKRQSSALCYGYCRPGNPPVATDDWLPAWEWLDEHGQLKRASKAHKRRGVWEIAESDWPVYHAYRTQTPELLPDEYWVRMLPNSILDKVCFLLGPMNRQDAQLQNIRQSMIGEETEWQRILWELYEVQQQHGWSTPEFQDAFARLVPKSWDCRRFGLEYECEFARLCHRRPGWEDPLASNFYVPRMPHHTFERQQAVERGLLPAEAQDVDEDE